MADVSLVAVGATACALSAIFGAVALTAQREHRRWCARGTKTDGVVSRLGQRRGTGLSEDARGVPTGTKWLTVAVVRFRAANGTEYEIDAPDAPQTIGTPVQVAYDPAEPSGARAVERVPKIGCAAILLVLGALLAAVGASRG